jgi:Cu2+-exporting ATPase
MGALSLSRELESPAQDLSRFIRRDDDGSQAFEAAVVGARCANCIAKIESGVGALEGVKQARLNLSTGKLAVAWKGRADPAAVLTRVRALGYQAQPFDMGEVKTAERSEGKFLLRCMAVAGFGTVFVMGLTDAIWYGGEDMNAATRNLFFWLAAAVSVPVTLYASQPFFLSAWRVLTKGHTNMDVPISLAIVLSLGLSISETLQHHQNTYFDAAVMLAFLLLIGRYLDFLLRDRARSAAQHLVAMQSTLARRIKADGNLETVAARELVPGDRVMLSSGERVPADGTVEGETDADISLVTGETTPVAIASGAGLRSGSVVIGRPTVLRISARVEDSLVADLARLLEAGQQSKGRYVRLADKAAQAYVPFVTGAALLVFAVWSISGAPLDLSITNAITVLIITCPCALGLAVPAVQIVGTGRLFERGVLVKSGDALERLANIDTAVFDKTGTLTFGEPELQNGDSVPRMTLQDAASLARASRHPFARALAKAAGDGPVALNVSEKPGFGLEAVINGKSCRLGSAAWCGAEAAAGGSELWYRAGDQPPVRFAFHDRPRPDLKDMLAALAKRGVAVEMLTGDARGPAAEIALAAGITNWKSHVDPKQKAAHLEDLRRRGHHVLMVGDGLYDTGARALADVSMAPGSAADVSQLAADFVLRGDSLMGVVESLDVARKARSLVNQNFAFAAIYNVAAIPLAMLGLVSPLLAAFMMAGSSLAVTMNALRLAAGKAK